MGNCARNCYGATPDDIIRELKPLIPSWLLDFLFDLDKCKSGSDRANGLGNFNALSIFTASEVARRLRDDAKTSAMFDMSSPSKVLSKNMSDILRDFADLVCSGKGNELSDLDKKYNPNSNGISFPSDLDPKTKDAILDSLLRNDSFNGRKLGSGADDGINGNLIVLDTDRLPPGYDRDSLYDDIFKEGADGNPLSRIPINELENIELNKRKFICFDPVFDIDNYTFFENNDKPLLTRQKIENIRRVHNELLLPIYRYYYGESDNVSACQIKVIYGIGSVSGIRGMIGGSSFSKHISGEAVDFLMSGIDVWDLVDDIRKGLIKINFGVLATVNGIHITLPYTFENMEVRGMILTSPKKDRNSLKVDFI